MPTPSTENRSVSAPPLLAILVPIALAALLLPALFVILPSRQARSIDTSTSPFAAGAGTVNVVVPGPAAPAGVPATGSASMPDMQMTDSQSDQSTEMVSHAAVATTSVAANQQLAFRMEGDTKVFDLQAKPFRWEVLPGEVVDAFGYAGPDGVATVPGPLLRVTEGDKVRVNFTNHLVESTVIHFHGPRLPNSMDGVAGITQQVIQPGETFQYEFTASPTGTFMYHTHQNSAVQESRGLYGVFQVDPKDGPRVQADHEVFQILSELGGFYLINGKAFPATEPITARLGEKVLIHLVNLGQMTHPMHMHGAPFQVVGTDGYSVPEAARITKDVMAIAPGERYDLLMLADNPGTWLFHCHILSHVQNHGVEPGGMLTAVKVEG